MAGALASGPLVLSGRAISTGGSAACRILATCTISTRCDRARRVLTRPTSGARGSARAGGVHVVAVGAGGTSRDRARCVRARRTSRTRGSARAGGVHVVAVGAVRRKKESNE